MRKLILTGILAVVMTFNNSMVLNEKNEFDYIQTEPIEAEFLIKEQQQILEEEIQEFILTKQKQREMKIELNQLSDIEDTQEWFLAYKDLISRYDEWIKPPETIFDVFSEEEITLICRVVETETFDQDFDSKVNVACVIFNRLENGKFGDSITEIITNPKQFAYWRKNITESTILAVEYAYMMEDTTQGALYFNSFKEAPEVFNGANYIDTDKAGHHFYGLKEE